MNGLRAVAGRIDLKSDQNAEVILLDYKAFPKPIKGGALGILFGKVVHGMTVNFFSDAYYPFDLDDTGAPLFSLQRAIRSIRYSMASEILVALKYLAGEGWFEDEGEVEFFIEGLEPLDEVKVKGWSEVWDTSSIVDMAYYLEDVCSELESSGGEFSIGWYYAKVSHLYFLDGNVPDVAMTIGILLSQMWWKQDLEETALRGQEHSKSLRLASEASKARSVTQSHAKNETIAKLWHECVAVHGRELMHRDANASQAIYALAIDTRPPSLLIKSSGEVIGHEAIRKRLSSLRKLGKIG